MPGTYDGQEYQHALIDVQMNLPGIAPIKSVTFSKLSGKLSAEKKPVYDSQGNIVSYTIDNKKVDPSITILLSEWRRIRYQMVNAGLLFVPQKGPLQIAMDWTITIGNSVLNYRTDIWKGVMFQGDPLDSSNDQNAIYAEMPLFVRDILPDGQASMVYRPY
jgi:hypothetical protein